MTDPNRTAQRETDQNARSDAATSGTPGGVGQKEQEPGRARRAVQGAQTRPDAQIRTDLDALLRASDDFDPAQVELLVTDGIVVMMGVVPDYPTKRRLDAACAAVPGVRELHDQLQVHGETLSVSSEGLRGDAPRAGFRGAGS